jgi:hypothetical protein
VEFHPLPSQKGDFAHWIKDPCSTSFPQHASCR